MDSPTSLHLILVWDLIVGSLVEISDARRLFPHLTTVYGLPSMFSKLMAGLFIPWRLLYPMVRDLFSNLKDQLPRNGISRYEKSMED